MITIPGPRGRPLEIVRPEVSVCNRIPWSFRPVSKAANAWPPSWVMVIMTLVYGQIDGRATRANAASAVRAIKAGGGAGCTDVARRHTSPNSSTGPA